MEDPFPALLLGLDLLPALANATGCPRVALAEDVRMPANQLVVNAARDLLEIASSLLLEEQREEEDLEQKVAELVAQLRFVAGLGRVSDLVCLFDRVRDDRLRGLLSVPGTVPAQPPRQLLEVEERLREWHAADVTRSRSRWAREAPGGSKPAA